MSSNKSSQPRKTAQSGEGKTDTPSPATTSAPKVNESIDGSQHADFYTQVASNATDITAPDITAPEIIPGCICQCHNFLQDGGSSPSIASDSGCYSCVVHNPGCRAWIVSGAQLVPHDQDFIAVGSQYDGIVSDVYDVELSAQSCS